MSLAMIPGNENPFCAALSLFVVCCACRQPGIHFCFSVNQSWEFHTEDQGGRERRRKRNNNKLNRV